MPTVAKEEEVKGLLIATLLLVSIALVPGAAFGQPETQIVSSASGAQEVPPVRTRTKGTLTLNFRPIWQRSATNSRSGAVQASLRPTFTAAWPARTGPLWLSCSQGSSAAAV